MLCDRIDSTNSATKKTGAKMKIITLPNGQNVLAKGDEITDILAFLSQEDIASLKKSIEQLENAKEIKPRKRGPNKSKEKPADNQKEDGLTRMPFPS